MEQKKSVESMEGMIRCSANHVPLSPISFLERSASVYRDRVAIVYGRVKFTWRDTLERCTRLASAITHLGISRGDVVAALAPNIPAMYELHFGVPMAGAVLCTLNIRHDSAMVSTLLKHSEAKMIFVDYQLLDTAQGALEILSKTRTKLPQYETLIAMGKTDFDIRWPNDEWDPIALNYTSGTTSRPKGVIYSHRAQGGTNVCLRNVTAKGIFDSISQHRVTHMGGAPTVLNMIINAPEVDIKDPVTMKSVPPDAKTIGEVMFRGNTVMNGYLKDIKATEESFKGGWFRSGDLGVKHPDGYIELKDPILEAAVVGRPDDHWGETPCAFVKLKEGCNANANEIIKFCRNKLPHYMAPKTVVFYDLPKTSTGKTQKYILKEKAKAMGSLSKRSSSKMFVPLFSMICQRIVNCPL
ncbi:unnamed protein product, partial [Vitis vinifera]